jgi:hypothetical protein
VQRTGAAAGGSCRVIDLTAHPGKGILSGFPESPARHGSRTPQRPHRSDRRPRRT